MKVSTLLFVITLFFIKPAFPQTKNTIKNERFRICREMKKSMVDELLKPWYPAAIDTVDGGFLSTFTYDFKPQGNQDKMIVTQARHVWSNAKAAELFPSIPWYKKGAAVGYRFLRDKMWDKQYGGFYTYTDRQGNPKQGGFAPKEAYGNSFAIYALAAYYQSTGDTSALNLAIKEFHWLEAHSHDPVFKGYYQHMERDGTPIKRTTAVPTTAETGYKDQNTSIHLLESFTELYSVWPDSLLKLRLQEMLHLVRDVITDKRGDLTLFFQPDWTPVSYHDSTFAVMMKHKELDHVSFGHNIETAWLMLETSHVLGIRNDTLTNRIAKKMVDDALENGWDAKVGGFYDEGYYFKDKPGITIIADTKNWWAQAEGLNALLTMADKYPHDPYQYDAKFEQLWQYIQIYLIDHEHGDWYQGGLDKQPDYKLALKGQIWKGTYHNFRSLMNCTNALHPNTAMPPAPSGMSYNKGTAAVLRWHAPKSKNLLLGYNIYLNGQRIGFTPLTYWYVPAKIRVSKKITVRSVDLQGNESVKAAVLK
ncbi:AGE family epimerase/isomerase [Mucilaginibacter gotjawali]|uniref:Mannobiose 2-epimerase n=2 Tax=Mucilaginibacter gotjawali TaxID=1550579 RepID=A0A839SN06_9SPHI|nr:AGE family epimerase/isomerase [Mucilaginibacter gotjawali]MBB3058614.1 mannobiose 2-epimerase [Mucilaginibacter gotjawali]BAU52419.1 Cellobiose 2-epimerase [Mucilaginibacter gotjawali]